MTAPQPDPRPVYPSFEKALAAQEQQPPRLWRLLRHHPSRRRQMDAPLRPDRGQVMTGQQRIWCAAGDCITVTESTTHPGVIHIGTQHDGQPGRAQLTVTRGEYNAFVAGIKARERDRWKQNARNMALLAEAFIYERHRITEGAMVAAIHRILTDEDIDAPLPAAPTAGDQS
jgi:hypothetical protein